MVNQCGKWIYKGGFKNISTKPQLPSFKYCPSLVRDKTFIYILAGFESSQVFSDHKFRRGPAREILSFDLGQGTSSILEVQLPLGVGELRGAIKFGKNTAFLFPSDGSMWEMGLQGLTFQKNFTKKNIHLPSFKACPSVLRDKSFIYILAGFEASPIFPDHNGIFKIDPVALTSQFLHVEDWPLANGSRIYEVPPPAVYIPNMKRIYAFGGCSRNRSNSMNVREQVEIFYIDLSPLSETDQVGEQDVTNETIAASANKEATAETLTKVVDDATLSGVPSLQTEYKFICSNLLRP